MFLFVCTVITAGMKSRCVIMRHIAAADFFLHRLEKGSGENVRLVSERGGRGWSRERKDESVECSAMLDWKTRAGFGQRVVCATPWTCLSFFFFLLVFVAVESN